MKKTINIIINTLIIFLLIGILSFIIQDFPSIKSFTVNKLYYPLINPRGGSLTYEKEYKIKSDKAEKLRLKTNALVTEMQKKSLDLGNQKMSEFNQSYDVQLTDIFNERDQLLKDLIEIDNKSLKLALPSEYKEFYTMRAKADSNEYDAFREYKEGMDKISKSMALFELDEKYYPLMDVLIDKDQLTKENIPALELGKSQLESFYSSRISPLIEDNFFTKDINEGLDYKMTTARAIYNFQIARLSEDHDNASKYYQEIESLSQHDSKPAMEVYLEWSKERVQPYFYKQDQKHKESYSLFNNAYKYAKSKNLNEIIGIWNGEYPGSAEQTPPQPTYNL